MYSLTKQMSNGDFEGVPPPGHGGNLRVFLPTRAMGTLRVFLPLDMVRRDAEEHGRREEPLSRGGVPG